MEASSYLLLLHLCQKLGTSEVLLVFDDYFSREVGSYDHVEHMLDILWGKDEMDMATYLLGPC